MTPEEIEKLAKEHWCCHVKCPRTGIEGHCIECLREYLRDFEANYMARIVKKEKK